MERKTHDIHSYSLFRLSETQVFRLPLSKNDSCHFTVMKVLQTNQTTNGFFLPFTVITVFEKTWSSH